MHVTDDRGNRVRLIPQWQLSIVRGLPSPIPMEARIRVYGEAQEVQLSREFVVPIIFVLLGIVIWGGLWMAVAPRMLPSLMLAPTLKAIITAIVPFLPLPLFMWFLLHRSRHRIVRIVTRHGFCASCGYALADIPAAPDRCTVCPECGSAWRLPGSTNA